MERVLSYGDVLLRRRDVDLLTPPNFINDNILDFFLSHLSSSSLSSSSSDTILMVSPSTSFWIVNSPDPHDLTSSLAPLRLHRRHIVLFPVNNGSQLDYDSSGGLEEQGTHWSLLVFHRRRNVCLHFDSMADANEAFARALHARLAALLGVSTPGFVSAATPQQRNGYDCGAYVMAAAAAIKKEAESGGDDWEKAVAREVNAESVRRLRESTIELIQSLGQQQQASTTMS